MATLAAVRDALKTTIGAAVTALHVYDTWPETVNLPAVIIAPTSADFVVAMGRGTDTWEFDLYVLAPYAVADLGQDALDGFITGAGSNSIRAAIYATRGLGLSGVDAHVSGMSSYGARFDGAAINHVGAILALTVHTTGTA